MPAEHAVAISVSDTGIGIAPADQEKIFEDFRQLDNSPTRAYGGTGLGLSICRRLAQMLNGRLSVQSQLGKGSSFTLTLPVQGRK
jgi:signal transduction histidine kinase